MLLLAVSKIVGHLIIYVRRSCLFVGLTTVNNLTTYEMIFVYS